jgi:NADH-quinone oxidoreductase subunit F
MLADKDRIFTNVYGFQPWNLPAAKSAAIGTRPRI